MNFRKHWKAIIVLYVLMFILIAVCAFIFAAVEAITN